MQVACRVVAAIALVLLCSLSHAQTWGSTRTTTYDYSCTDAGGKVVSGHTRLDAAFAACSNLVLKDGVTRYVQGGRYRIERKTAAPVPVMGSANLSWVPPAQNTDGSALTDLAGYRILYGTSSSALTQAIQLSNSSLSSYVVESLSPGPWYFCIKALNAAGGESECSNVASRAIR